MGTKVKHCNTQVDQQISGRRTKKLYQQHQNYKLQETQFDIEMMISLQPSHVRLLKVSRYIFLLMSLWIHTSLVLKELTAIELQEFKCCTSANTKRLDLNFDIQTKIFLPDNWQTSKHINISLYCNVIVYTYLTCAYWVNGY